MRLKSTFFVIFSLVTTLAFANGGVIEREGTYYYAGKIVVKFKGEIANEIVNNGSIPAEWKGKFNLLGEISVVKRFDKLLETEQSAAELNKVFTLNYTSPLDPRVASAKVNSMDEIEWAEPYFLYETVLVPNDPFLTSQYALGKIDAESAWNINTGNPDIIIAINDTGVDWDHPDLAANIWQNDDPVNGTDDDGNGYIDDVRGWDFGGLSGVPDNDPMEDRPDHGSHVAGIAGAVTNNNFGIASIGFNCTIMPVKTSQDNVRNNQGLALISHGYEGLVYAADNGAKVINCSWGGFSYSILGQEVVDYVLSKECLIVAAAGNDGIGDIIYPAGYDGVLSVGSTTSSDVKSGFSNYGVKIDVLAPGSAIYGTWQNDTFIILNGTSMSSPLAAGLAGLVFSQFPQFSPLQVAEQIRVNADNIDGLNPGYEYMLGTGRINANKALLNSGSKSVRITEAIFTDEGDGDGILEPGEDVAINLDFTNYLSPVSALSISAETTNPHIQFISSNYSAGSVPSNSGFSNTTNPFRFNISPTAPSNTMLSVLVKFSDAGYDDFQWVSAIINPTYATQGGNKIALTITSKGTLGFNDFPNASQGDGFKFDGGPNLLFEGALMYGVSQNQVMNGARESQTQSDDFVTITPFTIKVPGDISDQQGFTAFNDDGAGGNKLGISTELHSYTFTDEENENYIILEYKFSNNSGSAVNGLRAGLFFDWDLIDGSGNGDATRYDQADNFAYVYNTAGGPDTYIGAALISDGSPGYYGIANGGGNGSFSIYDGFSNAEKWLSLSEGVLNPNLPAGDISLVVSGGSYDIDANKAKLVAFVIAAGGDLDQLRETVQRSRVKYGSLITGTEEINSDLPATYSLAQNYPNPFNPATKIKFTIPADHNTSAAIRVSLTVFDILGREVATLVDGPLNPGLYEIEFNAESLSSGVYFYRLKTGTFADTKKMMLVR